MGKLENPMVLLEKFENHWKNWKTQRNLNMFNHFPIIPQVFQLFCSGGGSQGTVAIEPNSGCLKNGRGRPGAVKRVLRTFLIRYSSKAHGRRLGAPQKIYEYILYQICFISLRKQKRSSKKIYVYIAHQIRCRKACGRSP